MRRDKVIRPRFPSGLMLVLPSAPPASAFSFIDATSKGSSSGGDVTTDAINTSGAGLLIAAVSWYEPVAITVSDNKSNSWSYGTKHAQTNNVSGQIFYSVADPAKIGAGHTVTLSGGGTNCYGSILFAAFSGGAAVPFDQETGNDGVDTHPHYGTGITPTADNELIIAMAGCANGTLTTIDSSFNIMSTPVTFVGGGGEGLGGAYFIQTSLASVSPVWTNDTTAVWTSAIASFKFS